HTLQVYAFFFLSEYSLQGEYQRKLYKELMESYNRLERPVLNDSAPIVVELGLTLLQIIDVDEKNQVLITNAWLQLGWTDIYLSWNPDNYPGVQTLRFPSNQIWTPDILLYNRYWTHSYIYIILFAWSILKSTCYIDVRWFPFDIQKCDLKFGSWTHNGWLLDLQMQAVDISTYIPNGEWDLVGVPGKRNELYYECCKEPYPDVTFTVTMRRRTLYYGLNLLIPCVLISGLALLVFLLPADSGEKISLGITVLLSLTVFMLLVAEIMPATSDSVPLIAQYFASTMMIVGLSVVVTVLILQFHHHDPQGGKMPRWVSENSNVSFSKLQIGEKICSFQKGVFAMMPDKNNLGFPKEPFSENFIKCQCPYYYAISNIAFDAVCNLAVFSLPKERIDSEQLKRVVSNLSLTSVYISDMRCTW
uniref:Si:ch73-380n15.2 n=1 Tax=Sinocyclocheilus rhinocerous TaxID=307959 RepID=A0A673LJZ0_9TELE